MKLPEVRRLMLDMYDKFPPSTIAEMAGRSVGYIRCLASAMGLKSVGRGKNYSPYFTKSEIEFIRFNFGRMPVFHIAREIGRTEGSVMQKARRLGLGRCRSKLWSSEEDAEIIRSYAEVGTKELSTKLGRSRNAIKNRARFLGVKRDLAAYKNYHPWAGK